MIFWGRHLVAGLAMVVGGLAGAGYAADDLVLDSVENKIVGGEGQAVLVVGGGRQVLPSEYDLDGLFDQQAFGRLAGRNQQVFIVNGRRAARNPNLAEQALASVRGRCAERIETLEKVCGLDARQVRTLMLALESDLKRIGSQIEAERERYVDRTMPATPQGLDRRVLEEMQERAVKIPGILDSLPGPDSLLGSVVHNVLSPDQASAFATWVEGRRACRWKAMVTTVLVTLDESGLGLSSAQYAALEKCLLADVPKLDVLRDGSIGNFDGRMATLQRLLVISRLGPRQSEWEETLDPRQQAMLMENIARTKDRASLELNLIDQGMLERDGTPTRDKTHDKETK